MPVVSPCPKLGYGGSDSEQMSCDVIVTFYGGERVYFLPFPPRPALFLPMLLFLALWLPPLPPLPGLALCGLGSLAGLG